MLNSYSPYMLLKRIKPPAPAVYTTTYDLYSAAAQESHSHSPDPFITAETSPVHSLPPNPPVRTHYISSIHNRHRHAIQTARLSAVPSYDSFSPHEPLI